MQVILLEKVHKLGSLGEKVKVRPGYGRNFLIPSGKAILANTANLAKFEAQAAELKASAQAILKEAENQAQLLTAKDAIFVIQAKAAEEGKLFGSISTRDIAKSLTNQANCKVLKQQISLPEGIIRYLGDYPITVQLHADVCVKIIIKVVAEKRA